MYYDQIFNRLSRLKISAFGHLSLTHDMTKMEREEKNKMTEKAKKMTNYFFWGGSGRTGSGDLLGT